MAPDLHTLTGAYAADALEDDEERREFEQHLAQCADCREEVRTLRETVAVLAAALAVPPPPGLRARVMADVAATRQWPPPRQVPSDRATGPRWLSVAAGLVLVAGVAAGGAGLLEARQANQERDAAQRRADQIASVLADSGALKGSAEVAGGGQATLVVAGAKAVVVTAGVPGLPSGRTYQLWLLRGEQISSAGLGPAGQAGAGAWSRLLDGLRPGDKVAISVEPDGGSPQPTSTPVTVLEV